jgi:hypothetical protein
MTNIKNLAVRTGAVFVSSALATIGVGSIFGINAAIAAGMAGSSRSCEGDKRPRRCDD